MLDRERVSRESEPYRLFMIAGDSWPRSREIQICCHLGEHKGSYSFFGSSSQETQAKIIIYEEGKDKVNAPLHLRAGVYARIRANGMAGERNHECWLPTECSRRFRASRPSA